MLFINKVEKKKDFYIDQWINELVRHFTNCSIVNQRKIYVKLKYACEYKSDITGHLFVNPEAYRILHDFENVHISKNIIREFNDSLEQSIDNFEKATDIKINEYTHFLKLLMLKILYPLNVFYFNDKYKFIFSKNKIKKLNEKIKDEFKRFGQKANKNKPNRLKKYINFILKHDNPTDAFIKEYTKFYGDEVINSLN